MRGVLLDMSAYQTHASVSTQSIQDLAAGVSCKRCQADMDSKTEDAVKMKRKIGQDSLDRSLKQISLLR